MYLPLLLHQSNFELIERQTHLTSILLFVVLICSAVVGAGRINNPNFFVAISSGFFKFKTQDKSYNENNRISQGASAALYINYLISISLCFFLMIYKGTNFSFAFLGGIVISIFIFSLQQFGYRIAGLFAGQSEIVDNGSLITRQTWFFSGLFYLLVSLIWLLNMEFKAIFIVIFLTILLISSLFRILKGLLFAFWGGFSWYYIFLYLCTLEILPVFILNKLIQGYLQTQM
jgi:hypothetical protein